MKKQSFENRVATIIDAVKKASPRDSSIGIGRTREGDGLDLLVDVIEDLLRRSRESVTAFQSAQEAMRKLQISGDKGAEEELSWKHVLLMDTLEENIPDTIYFKDAQSRFINLSKAHVRAFSLIDKREVVGKTDFDFFTEEHAREAFEDEQRIIRTGEPIINKEEKETWPDRPATWVLTTKMPLRDQKGTIVGTFGISRDITERKQAEEARLSHLRFLESMDQVNRAIQGATDLEQLMSDVLDVVLSLFNCDRAWLVYPCDLEAASWSVPMERTRPEYPGAFAQRIELPVDIEVLRVFRTVIHGDGPVPFGPGSEHSLPGGPTVQFAIQSMVCMAIYPKVDKAYMFGLHQCSYLRIWTAEEKRLFQEIGRRLADALTSLLTYRKLRESENRYRRITEGLTDYQYSVRVENGRAVETTQSQACATVTGYAPEEFAADPYLWFRMVAPEDRELVRERVQQILAGRDIPPLEHRILCRDGSVRWVCDTTILLKDASGRLISYDGVIKDISERKRAEEVLRQSEERHRLFFNSVNDAVFVLGVTADGQLPGKITEVNDIACERLGYARDELLQMSPLDFDAPETAAIAAEMMVQLKAERHAVWEGIHISKAGLRIPVEISSHLFDMAGELTILSAVRDIAGRKQLEENLEREKTLLLTLIDNLPDYVSVKDTESRILITNAANAHVMGLERAHDAVGKTDLDFYPPSEAAQYIADELTVIQTGRALINKEEGVTDPEGHTRWILTTKVPLRDAQGKVTGVVCTGRDITERRQAEERIQDLARFPDEDPNPVMRVSLDGSILYANHSSRSLLTSWAGALGGRIPSEHMPELLQAWASGENREIEAREGSNAIELTITPILSRGYINLYGRDVTEEKSLAEKFLQAQKMEAVGRLAGGIAHDFNNLLTVIGGYCDLAQEELLEGSPVRAQVDEIAKATKRAAALTTKLLAFSRKQVLMPRVINPNDLLRAVESILARLVGDDIELRTFLEPEAGNIKADPGQIEQVLMNLVVNARDAMPDGGRLTIETSNRILDNSYALIHPGVKTGEYVLIAVSDTGQGMDQDVLSHLFEPFFTTKEQGKGTGLGLSTVYGIVKQSDGHITCYSESGKGTTFTIYFPRTVGSLDRTATPIGGVASLYGRETILLVEDDEMVRLFTQTVLEKNGYTVIGAPGGKEALAAMESQKCKVSLLVTDVVMPQMSGKELAQELLRACPSMKVLFVSGYSGSAITHHGILDPGLNFIQKPFDSKEFLAKIHEILNRQ